jgi:hypothetical protein
MGGPFDNFSIASEPWVVLGFDVIGKLPCANAGCHIVVENDTSNASADIVIMRESMYLVICCLLKRSYLIIISLYNTSFYSVCEILSSSQNPRGSWKQNGTGSKLSEEP